MKAELLATLPQRAISLDAETHRVQPGLAAPPIVCGAVATFTPEAGIRGALATRDQFCRTMTQALQTPGAVIVGANLPYDFLCYAVECNRHGAGVAALRAIFDKYERGEVFDVLVAEALHAIACGHHGKAPDGDDLRTVEGKPTTWYSLYNVTKLVTGRDTAKVNDRFKESYALLEHVPLELWPYEARTYPVDDVCNALEDALAQAGHLPRIVAHAWAPTPDGTATVCANCGANAASTPPPCRRIVQSHNLHDLSTQCYAHWAMSLGAGWGFAVDPIAIAELERRVSTERAVDYEKFIGLGYFNRDRHGAVEISKQTGKPVKNTAFLKRKVAAAYGCRGTCPHCGGAGKLITGYTKREPIRPNKWAECVPCNKTGLVLESAPIPRSDPSETYPQGQVATGRDPLWESGDDELGEFAEFAEDNKIEQTYLPFLKSAVQADGTTTPLTLKPNVLVASGRASYADVIDQLPRKGGVRECFVARPGRSLCSVDWSGIELVAHAQNCLEIPQIGFSKLAEVINTGGAGMVHAALAARMTGVSPEEFIKRYKSDKFLTDARTAAKWLNFGLPGGMGEAKLVHTCRKQGPDTECENGPVDLGKGRRGYKGLRFCILTAGAKSCGGPGNMSYEWKRRPITPTCTACLECARGLKAKWLEQWPENKIYFDLVAQLADSVGAVKQFVSGRIRGGLGFSDLANTLFQGRTADGLKRALPRVLREMYLGERYDTREPSELHGARLIKSAHDELIAEVLTERGHEQASRISAIMVQTMNEVCPDVANEAPPALMPRWYKGAEPVYHSGRLVEWTPDHNPKKCQECAA